MTVATYVDIEREQHRSLRGLTQFWGAGRVTAAAAGGTANVVFYLQRSSARFGLWFAIQSVKVWYSTAPGANTCAYISSAGWERFSSWPQNQYLLVNNITTSTVPFFSGVAGEDTTTRYLGRAKKGEQALIVMTTDSFAGTMDVEISGYLSESPMVGLLDVKV